MNDGIRQGFMEGQLDSMTVNQVTPRQFECVVLEVRNGAIDPFKFTGDFDPEASIDDARFDV